MDISSVYDVGVVLFVLPVTFGRSDLLVATVGNTSRLGGRSYRSVHFVIHRDWEVAPTVKKTK